MGNICRSPAAEGILRHYADQNAPAHQIAFDSAGTIGYHTGRPADERMRAAARRRGYELPSRARQVTHSDLDTFEFVLAMDRDNLADLRALHSEPTACVQLFSDYLDDHWPVDVPDPYYGDGDGFEKVLDMIEAACPRILHALRE